MAAPALLNTERLVGRPIATTDFARLRSIHQDPKAAATLSIDRQPFSKAHTRRSVQNWVKHWEQHGFGVWMFHQSDGEFVGYAGTMVAAVEDNSEIELLYAIRSEFWGRAYATEMSKAVLRFTFEHAAAKSIVAFTLPTNLASRRVMEKCGFRYERDITHSGLPHVLYRLRSEDFARAQEA
jgi:RimJ/RimL family protein N-acetyltransferase